MQQPIAILAVQLAAVDRRTLSQAWYSALHLARHDEPARAGRARGTALSPSRAGSQERASKSGRRPSAAVSPRSSRAPADRTVTREAGIDRRAPKTELARRIERGLARGIPQRRAAAFDVRALDGRVHLIVRSEGAATRVVAVCAPALRERVERALAQARFALAARGIRTEAA